MQVSIIIPVYNVETYIEKCLQSVADQTFNGEMECLIIDDCGQDNSMNIVEKFIQAYNTTTHPNPIEFRILHHSHNRGLSAARNTGIDNAKGDWIYFIDSDDWIIPKCIELMYECVKKHPDAELIHAGANATWGHEYMSIKDRKDLPEYANNKEWISQMLFRIWVTAWNNLIRKDFIIKYNLHFIEGMKHEDEIWTYDLSLCSSILCFCFFDTYIYLWRENSIMNELNDINGSLSSYCKVWNKEIDHLAVANESRPWFIKKIWHHIFHFYDEKCNFITRWKVRNILWRLASHSNWKMGIAIIMSSTLTNTFIDKYLYRRFIFGQLLWEAPKCEPII